MRPENITVSTTHTCVLILSWFLHYYVSSVALPVERTKGLHIEVYTILWWITAVRSCTCVLMPSYVVYYFFKIVCIRYQIHRVLSALKLLSYQWLFSTFLHSFYLVFNWPLFIRPRALEHMKVVIMSYSLELAPFHIPFTQILTHITPSNNIHKICA